MYQRWSLLLRMEVHGATWGVLLTDLLLIMGRRWGQVGINLLLWLYWDQNTSSTLAPFLLTIFFFMRISSYSLSRYSFNENFWLSLMGTVMISAALGSSCSLWNLHCDIYIYPTKTCRDEPKLQWQSNASSGWIATTCTPYPMPHPMPMGTSSATP